MRSEVSPFASIGDAYFYLGKASQIIMMHRDHKCSGVHALKVDRSLIDPIMKLQVDYPEIQKYLYVSQYDLLIDTSRMRLTAFTLLTPIGRLLDT
jgi:hypothetical protein